MVINKVYLEGIENCKISDLEIIEEVNNHSYAKIVGIIQQDKVKEVMNLGKKNGYIKLMGVTENGSSETMFVGLVYNIKVENDGDVNNLVLTLVSGTILMDGNEVIKTFQNSSTTYSSIFRNLGQAQNAREKMLCSDKAIDKMVVQYKETNWQFAKRLATNMETCIIPHVTNEGVNYYIGVGNNGPNNNIKNVEVRIKQSIDRFMTDNETDNLPSIAACLSYEFESREYFNIGSKVSLENIQDELYVYNINTKLIKSEIITSYILRRKEGFTSRRRYNNNIIGASLAGKITSVSGDKVKVSVEEDIKNSNGDCGSKEFSYSTVYSSPDGTGWYCMPEIGDKIRIYFPSDKEEDGYVISSVHLDVNDSSQGSNQSAARSNPDFKSISNKQKKEIIFAPDKLTITNNKGMEIILDDNEGITINSDKGVYLTSEGMVQLASKGDLVISGKDCVELTQDTDSKFIMENGEINISGATLKLQEKGE